VSAPKYDPPFETESANGDHEGEVPTWSHHCIEDPLVIAALINSSYTVRHDFAKWHNVSPGIVSDDVLCVGGKRVYVRGTLLTFEGRDDFIARLSRIHGHLDSIEERISRKERGG